MTTEVQDKPTLVLDGENHVIDDLSDKAKYLVSQLQDLQQQATQTATLLKEEIANPQTDEAPPEGELVQ
jgi:hypothetical protein